MADLRRIDVGFQGGQVLSLRAISKSYDELVEALGNDAADRWQTVHTDDADVLIDLAQVVYVRLEREDQKVGF